MTTVLVLALFGVFVAGSELRRRSIDLLSVFSGFYLVGYVLAPLHVLLGGTAYVETALEPAVERYEIGTPSSVLVIVFFYLFVRYAYLFVTARGENRRASHTAISPSLVRRAVVAALGASALSIAIYSAQYGGLIEAVRLAPAIRAGDVDVGGPFVFFKLLIPFSFVGLLLSYGLVLDEDTRCRWSLLLFGLSIGLVLLSVFLLAGRVRLIATLGVGYLTLVAYRERRYLRALLVIGVLSLAFVLGSGAAFYVFLRGPEVFSEQSGGTAAYRELWSQFTHMYVSLEAALQSPEHTPRYGRDWLYGPLHLLPEQLLDVDLPGTVAHVNTALLRGEYRSVAIPGVVALAWYSGELVGVLVGGLLYGAVGGALHCWLQRVERHPVQLVLYFSLATIWGFHFVRSGDPRILFRSHVVWFVVFGALAALLWWDDTDRGLDGLEDAVHEVFSSR